MTDAMLVSLILEVQMLVGHLVTVETSATGVYTVLLRLNNSVQRQNS